MAVQCPIVLMPLFLLIAVAHEDGWSMKVPPEVRAVEGYPVVLPCSFSHPRHEQHSSMLVQWRLGHGPAGVVLFQCASHNNSRSCQPEGHQDQRYRLEGDPRQHDLSLRINSAALQDSGHYYCRVEVPGHPHASFQNKRGMHLRVEAAPQILGLSVEGSEESGYSAVCRVQGSPLPDVQWSSPEHPRDDPPLTLLSQADASQHHTSSLLRDVQPGHHYTCAASNPLGREQATLFLLQPNPLQASSGPPHLLLLLSLSLGAKVLLFLGWLAWLLWRQWQ
ncbi:sialic acid-binding Ig-like lectin 15 [Paramormyrops kingsleyae]|uniref:sialic acid-binding Ig-like lectin 15 n=1 Tax=Paramormyrops kingsleyae TaxID=1676925 RepID=UPI000CD65057|nr:sialic acid-binding Ig-like lectin 15 [Paramormyrops kingsleyae]